VFEQRRDQGALDAHFQTPHMAAWRAVFPEFQVSDRNLKVYDVMAERPI
jgi:quinol monooxygenase YgiN